jgi:hypothetical protein
MLFRFLLEDALKANGASIQNRRCLAAVEDGLLITGQNRFV